MTNFRFALPADMKFINEGLSELGQPTIKEYNDIEKYIIYRIDGKNVGFINYSKSIDIVDLLGVYIKPSERGNGYSFILLLYFIDLCRKENISSIMLEVRSSNLIAINLYKKCGFKQIALRKNYYTSYGTEEPENAVIMRKMISSRREKKHE